MAAAEALLDEDEFTLTQEQEKGLAADPRLYSLAFLLLNRIPLALVMKGFRMDKELAERLLLRLDRLKFMELRSDMKFRALVPGNFRWRKDGPIASAKSERSVVVNRVLTHARSSDVFQFEGFLFGAQLSLAVYRDTAGHHIAGVATYGTLVAPCVQEQVRSALVIGHINRTMDHMHVRGPVLKQWYRALKAQIIELVFPEFPDFPRLQPRGHRLRRVHLGMIRERHP